MCQADLIHRIVNTEGKETKEATLGIHAACRGWERGCCLMGLEVEAFMLQLSSFQVLNLWQLRLVTKTEAFWVSIQSMDRERLTLFFIWKELIQYIKYSNFKCFLLQSWGASASHWDFYGHFLKKKLPDSLMGWSTLYEEVAPINEISGTFQSTNSNTKKN